MIRELIFSIYKRRTPVDPQRGVMIYNRLQQGEELTSADRMELYEQIDRMPIQSLRISAHKALVDHAWRNIDFSKYKDPFTGGTITVAPGKVFISAQGFAFDISNPDVGIMLYLQRCFNRNAPERTDTPINPINKIKFCDLDLQLLLSMVFTSDIERHAPDVYSVSAEEELHTYLLRTSRNELINLFRYRIFVNEILMSGTTEQMEDLHLTPINLYRIVAGLKESLNEQYVFTELSDVSAVDWRTVVMPPNGYYKRLIVVLYEYCDAKDAPKDEPERSAFVGLNMRLLLQCDPRILTQTIHLICFKELFLFTTFEELRGLSILETGIVVNIYSRYIHERAALISFLRELNDNRPEGSSFISLKDMLKLDSKFLLTIFGCEENTPPPYILIPGIIDLVKSGYLTYANMLEISSTNPSRLLSIALGYEGDALRYLADQKRYSVTELNALSPELLQEIYSLPRKDYSQENIKTWQKLKEKLRILPFSQEFISKVNNGKFGHLKDKSPKELKEEVKKLNLLSTRYDYSNNIAGEKIISIDDPDFMEFLQSRSSAHIESVAELVNKDWQKDTFKEWAEANEKDKSLSHPGKDRAAHRYTA